MHIGVNIKNRRLALKMTQQELADAMGYKTRSTIAKIEAGENDVSQAKLRKFAAALQTTVEALVMPGLEHSQPAQPFPALSNHRHIAVILAGGDTGKNYLNIPSQFVTVHGKPLIVYCMEVYQAHPAVDELYVVCLKGWESIVNAYARQYGITKLKGILPGGESGMLSLQNAVSHLSGCADEDVLIIQESTRPLFSVGTVSKLLQSCADKESAIICYSMTDYVQFHRTGNRVQYMDRSAMIALQSPEAHTFSRIREVFARADTQQLSTESSFTMLLYNGGYAVNFVEVGNNNIKIVKDEDVATFSASVRHL